MPFNEYATANPTAVGCLVFEQAALRPANIDVARQTHGAWTCQVAGARLSTTGAHRCAAMPGR